MLYYICLTDVFNSSFCEDMIVERMQLCEAHRLENRLYLSAQAWEYITEIIFTFVTQSEPQSVKAHDILF